MVAMTAGPGRETRIDILRGLAMVVIAINHITVAFQIYHLDGRGVPTPSSFGYSSSASIFVIMSGYMVGMVYQRKANPTAAVLRRAARLYVYDGLLLLAVTPVLAMMPAWEATAWSADFLHRSPTEGLLLFLALLRAPTLLDVLQLYVIFMLVTPVALWLHRRSATLLVGVSVGLWLASQLATLTGLLDPAVVEWKFNPAAWQIFFFVPMLLGTRRAHERVFAYLEAHRQTTILLAVTVGAFAAAKLLHIERHVPNSGLLTSKGNLGLLRLIHAPIIIAFYCGLLSWRRDLVASAPMRALACIGRQTLYCYMATVWITYVLAALWYRAGGGYATYLGAVMLAVLLTAAVAVVFDARARRTTAHRKVAITA